MDDYIISERWKDISGYKGLYMVSNYGRIKSFYGNEKILKLRKYNDGNYPSIILSKNNKQKTVIVHRIVANEFISNPENKKCINHINGDKSNNC